MSALSAGNWCALARLALPLSRVACFVSSPFRLRINDRYTDRPGDRVSVYHLTPTSPSISTLYVGWRRKRFRVDFETRLPLATVGVGLWLEHQRVRSERGGTPWGTVPQLELSSIYLQPAICIYLSVTSVALQQTTKNGEQQSCEEHSASNFSLEFVPFSHPCPLHLQCRKLVGSFTVFRVTNSV